MEIEFHSHFPRGRRLPAIQKQRMAGVCASAKRGPVTQREARRPLLRARATEYVPWTASLDAWVVTSRSCGSGRLLSTSPAGREIVE